MKEKYLNILKIKQGGSINRSIRKWSEAREKANKIIGRISQRDLLMLMIGIYWGEGSKRELNLINGNPYLVKTFIDNLIQLGVSRDDIRINLRIYNGMDIFNTKSFWIKFLNIRESQVGNSELLEGNGSNRLEYGMCRVRVIKSGPYFKLITSMIDLVKSSKMPS